MYKYSIRSKQRLDSCHPDLQKIFNIVIKFYDNSILEGTRNEERQNYLYSIDKSSVIFPNSKHNTIPSNAVDAVPYPIDFSNQHKNIARYYHFAGFVKGVANMLGIKIRWGGDWDGDRDFTDQTFDDLQHFELIQ